MMKQEFEKLAKMEISFEDYNNIIEPMYLVTDMNKEEFVKFIRPSVRPLAKKYAAEKKARIEANQKKIFISDGRYTPNGCYYIGIWAALVDIESDVKTGANLLKVRELTEAEQRETGFDRDRSYKIDAWVTDYDEIEWIA